MAGAFGNSRWSVLETQLLVQNYPVNLHGMVRVYFRDQEIVIRHAEGEGRRRTSKAFVDDAVLKFSGQLASSMEEDADQVLTYVNSYGVKNKLNVTFDRKPTFTPHVTKVCKKAANVYKGLSRAAKVTWVLNSYTFENHIHCRNRPYRFVRFVRLGTGYEKARRAKDA
ncbi:hypothetical protein EVAR_61624_1 [Eumeta japonica]|uniref:Uncharacterized protein n=1 Tax=Eumeta variegata TaxID=151549 RepID=A0A4C1ZJ43_EUMVA|nr:hypothetical protein EVAR_61624_1 [Eumeta japonica]